MDIYYTGKQLNSNYVMVDNDTTIMRANLFSFNTKVFLFDPTLFSPLGTYTPTEIENANTVFNGDFTQPSAIAFSDNWTNAGWNIFNQTTFINQLKTFIENNLPDPVVPGYNLRFSVVPWETNFIFSYSNVSLTEFTYDEITGTIQYLDPVDLSNVTTSHSFGDSLSNYYDIIAVDDGNDNIIIRKKVSGDIPTALEVSTTAPLTNFDGAIFSKLQGFIEYYAIAFVYRGNQGSVLP